jgi:hypothetical protein
MAKKPNDEGDTITDETDPGVWIAHALNAPTRMPDFVVS